MKALSAVAPTVAEIAAARPGDDLIAEPDVVMDRAFTVNATPAAVWPWLVQLGKGRAGWYFPHAVERFIPRSHRAVRTIRPEWQHLRVNDVIPDYGGRHQTFAVAIIEAPTTLVYTSRRGRTDVTWSIHLAPAESEATRLHLRLRLGPVRHRRVAETLGGFVDLVTIAGMAAGLRERLRERPRP